MPLFTPYVLSDGRSATPIPSNPIILMKLTEFVFENGDIFLGPHLMTGVDIDEFVSTLVRHAEDFRRLAKHELELAASRPPPAT